jgi:hypothetical protein
MTQIAGPREPGDLDRFRAPESVLSRRGSRVARGRRLTCEDILFHKKTGRLYSDPRLSGTVETA